MKSISKALVAGLVISGIAAGGLYHGAVAYTLAQPQETTSLGNEIVKIESTLQELKKTNKSNTARIKSLVKKLLIASIIIAVGYLGVKVASEMVKSVGGAVFEAFIKGSIKFFTLGFIDPFQYK